jgi:hypothetical protein
VGVERERGRVSKGEVDEGGSLEFPRAAPEQRRAGRGRPAWPGSSVSQSRAENGPGGLLTGQDFRLILAKCQAQSGSG